MSKDDEMLRIYRTPEGFIAYRIGNFGMVCVNPESNHVFFQSFLEDYENECAQSAAKTMKLKRIKTINLTLEKEIVTYQYHFECGRSMARKAVRQARKMAHMLMDAVRGSIKVRAEAPNGDTTITRWERGKYITEKEADPLDAEFIE